MWGKSYKGHAAIRGYFEALFATTSDVQWRHTAEFVCGDRAVTEWHRTATLASGEKQEWLGCDLYVFRNGQIVMKDTFIKVVG
ncbi:SnoaL-like domain protein [compost metagenome]